ncbi:MAG: ClbS/DfsB family four-helix bundle protein [Chloroflexi bacterium]|nr:ClbS/DfsB family four-helix bundle protein [Chloroflexota bacterium]
MTSFKQRTLDFLEIEWATYIERFNRLPPAEGLKRVNGQGYERFRDMLAHIVAWWEEGMDIILAIAEEREFERKKYDFDIFNAEAVATYKNRDEKEFLAHFEQVRQKSIADLKSMNEAAWENRRVRGWVNGIFIDHAREHLVALDRFLLLDMLQNEWATYLDDFNRLDDAEKNEFIGKQGFGSFHNLLAHFIGGWEEGMRIVDGFLNQPGFTWQEPETDAFNLELTKKYSTWSHADLLKHYEATRAAMIELVTTMPDDALRNPDIENWLTSDVIHHYHDHVI